MTQTHEQIKKERIQNRLGPEIQDFREACKTLQLATITPEGLPHVSYAPFGFDGSGYYILVSDLAIHGVNLKSSKHVSIMMVEDEVQAKSVHARKRLTFDTKAEWLEKQTEAGQAGIKALVDRFGDMASNLSQLGDFNLYRLTPSSGRYVKGFGQAFVVTGSEMVDFIHLNEGQGHIQPEHHNVDS